MPVNASSRAAMLDRRPGAAAVGPRRWLGLAAWIALCVVGGAAGGLVTDPDSAWYRALDKPVWNPPSAVFGPVWTTLYTMMGVAAWRVWRRGTDRDAVNLFLLHLLPNFAWSFLFFGAQEIALALVDILVLWALILALVVQFWRADRLAGGLLVPYALWVTFAAVLNAELLRRNG